MSNTEDDKIMGFVPKDKYVLIAYYLLLAAVGLGTVSTILGILGVYVPLGSLGSLAGVCALVLGLAGYFGFKDQFNSLDQNHLLYICVLFGVFFLVGVLLGSALAMVPILLYLVVLLLDVAGLALSFAGYNSYKHGRTITKDNVKSEVQLALKRA